MLERVRQLCPDVRPAASPSFGYASLGLSLEQYGINAVLADVPGAVPVTAAEQKAFACGDLTPTEVAAGQTTPTCGVVTSHRPTPGGQWRACHGHFRRLWLRDHRDCRRN